MPSDFPDFPDFTADADLTASAPASAPTALREEEERRETRSVPESRVSTGIAHVHRIRSRFQRRRRKTLSRKGLITPLVAGRHPDVQI